MRYLIFLLFFLVPFSYSQENFYYSITPWKKISYKKFPNKIVFFFNKNKIKDEEKFEKLILDFDKKGYEVDLWIYDYRMIMFSANKKFTITDYEKQIEDTYLKQKYLKAKSNVFFNDGNVYICMGSIRLVVKTLVEDDKKIKKLLIKKIGNDIKSFVWVGTDKFNKDIYHVEMGLPYLSSKELFKISHKLRGYLSKDKILIESVTLSMFDYSASIDDLKVFEKKK